MLLATHVKPAVPRAKLITLLALIDYAFAGLLGVITLFIAFLHQVTTDGQLVSGFLTLLERLVWLVVFAFAAFVALRVYLGAYVVAKPKLPPGTYGGYPGYQPAPRGALLPRLAGAVGGVNINIIKDSGNGVGNMARSRIASKTLSARSAGAATRGRFLMRDASALS